MSLFETLIFEPAAFEVFIALRNDGVYGSGRADDPYSGATLDNPKLDVLTITRSGATATVQTVLPHGFVTNQLVQIAGIAGVDDGGTSAINSFQLYNGIFQITSTGANTFTYTMAGDPGGSAAGAMWCKRDSGIQITSITSSALVATVVTSANHGFKANDVVRIAGVTGISGAGTNQYFYYNGSFVVTPDAVDPKKFTYAVADLPGGPAASSPGVMTCQLDPYLFDKVMRGLATSGPVTVRVGPGVFETRGHANSTDPSSWRLVSGMKLVGSGMAQTTLKLVDATFDHKHYYCVGSSSSVVLDSVGVLDLSCDCNIARQPSNNTVCGAVQVKGRHTRLKRIRAINFGRQSLSLECFVLAVMGATPGDANVSDCVVEECLLEAPAQNNLKETTGIIGICGEGAYTTQAYIDAMVVRNCVINCEFQDNPVPIAGITSAANAATVTTLAPHGVVVGQWVRISGARIAGSSGTNQFDNVYNGCFKVATAPTTTSFTYAVAANAVAAAGEMWLGRWPSQRVALETITPVRVSTTPNVWQITVVTSTPHFLSPGNVVSLNNAVSSGATLNRIWNVTRISGNKQFVCQALFAATDPSTPTNLGAAFIGVNFQGVTVGGGSLGIMEGNFIANCTIGGPYADTFSTKDIIVRNNYYRSVLVGILQNMGGAGGDGVPDSNGNPTPPHPTAVAYTAHTGSSKALATVTLANSHGYSVGQAVVLQSLKVGGNVNNPYNGSFLISAIPSTPVDPLDGSPTSFVYALNTDPLAAPDSGSLSGANVRPLWQMRDCVIENNTFEIIRSANDGAQASGISLFAPFPTLPFPFDTPSFPPYIYRRVVIKSNAIRYADYIPDAQDGRSSTDLAMQLLYCEDARVENNIVDLRLSDGSNVSDHIRHGNCGTVRYFNNVTPNGLLVQGAEGPNNPVKQDELVTAVEAALTFCSF